MEIGDYTNNIYLLLDRVEVKRLTPLEGNYSGDKRKEINRGKGLRSGRSEGLEG